MAWLIALDGDLTGRRFTLNVPCLVVSFELDVLVPAALGQELAAAIPGSDYRCIEGCGHGGLWERPNEANTAIIEFLHQTAATA